MPADPNRMLYILSAHGSMKWPEYCEAVDTLSVSGSIRGGRIKSATGQSGLLNALEALGHCDVHYERGKSTISITPPALCRLPRAGLPVAVLTGARSLQTHAQMATAAQASGGAVRLTVEHLSGPLGLLPDTIQVSATSEEAIVAFCADIGIRYAATPPAWMLVNWCGTSSEYETTLDFRTPDTLHWLRYDFNVSSFDFRRQTSGTLPRLTRYRNPTTGVHSHFFFREQSGAEVEMNWGRYLLLNSKGITITAYDERRYRLCVPVKVPLPGVVARIVCLCSGKPPVHSTYEDLIQNLDCRDWLLFEDVPPQIAWAALSKVGQNPVRVEIR